MAENAEIEDRVELDDDNNYSEEEDYVKDGENGEELKEDASNAGDGKKHSTGTDRNDIQIQRVEAEEGSTLNNEDEKEKHSELLDLPPRSSEVFIGGLSPDISEEDLRELCESFGEIFEVKVIKDRDTGESKGFAFVSFRTKDAAQKAIEELHNKEFRGRTLRSSLSETKYRLFIRNVPKSLTDDDFRNIIESVGPGAENIELRKDPQNPGRNRGFAFVEYYNNASADYARQQMSSESFKIDGNTPTVTWANRKYTREHSAAASLVKALYVKNIPENTTTEQLKELFQHHGEVTEAVMPPSKSGGKRDFGFVHFAERSSALKALKDTEKYEISGQVLEVVLARPQTEKKFNCGNPHNTSPMPNYIPHTAYTATAGHGAGAGGFQQQPVIYGRGTVPAGMQMVPMGLPDGRIGYVLQQPRAQMPSSVRSRGNDRNNGSARGRSGNDDTNRNRRYQPY